MKKPGKFIVIEGIDGSGKTTQFNLLSDRLNKKRKVLIADFPRYYESIWGKIVGEFLVGKYGKFKELDPHLVVLPYMIDEYTWSRDIGRLWLDKGGVILSNRFFTSNVHQIAKLEGKSKSAFRKWLWLAGYKELGILKPDLVLFLDVPPDVSFKLNKKKSVRSYLKGRRKKDFAESDRLHQIASYKEYQITIKQNPNWVKIDCLTNGVIDSPENIHSRIWNHVENIL